MLEEHNADVESLTSLDVDRKPVNMTTAFRDYPPQPPSRPGDAPKREPSPSRLPPINNGPQYHSQGDAWMDALNRVHSELQYHNSLFEAQRRDFDRLEAGLERLQAEMGNWWAHLEAIGAELRSRAAQSQDRPDGGDLDILTGQVQSLTAKVPEIEGLKMQMEIMKRRVRRLEGTGSPPPAGAPSIEQSPYQQPTAHPHAAPLPPMHSSAPSTDSRTMGYSQSADSRLPPPSHIQSTDSRTMSGYPPSDEARTLPPLRALEAASGVSSWRSASSYNPSQGSTVPPEPHHPHAPEPQQPTGWAAVNVNSNIKRPSLDEQQGSPKRQKLATLMPRTSYGDQSVSSSHSYHPSGNGTPETTPASLQPQRTSSSDVQSQSQSQPFTASNNSASTASQPLRFVQFPTTQDADSQDSWRPESQRMPLEAARGGGGRGRGGRRTRGGRKSTVGSMDREHDAPLTEYGNNTTSWAPDGFHAYSASSPPAAYSGGGIIPPETPHGGGAVPPETPTSDASKKSRTKPIRNKDGILIRKDGRPDMRSVSSAMNLRKVHAKKEAERAGGGGGGEGGEGQNTPTSHHSGDTERDQGTDSPGTPATAAERSESREQDGGGGVVIELDRHRENMRKIFPQGDEALQPLPPLRSKTVAEQALNPRTGEARADVHGRAEQPRSVPETPPVVETLPVERMVEDMAAPHPPPPPATAGARTGGDSQMTDIALREMAEAQLNQERSQRMDVDGETAEKSS